MVLQMVHVIVDGGHYNNTSKFTSYRSSSKASDSTRNIRISTTFILIILKYTVRKIYLFSCSIFL